MGSAGAYADGGMLTVNAPENRRTVFQSALFKFDLLAFGLDAQTQAPENAHVRIGYPDQREHGNENATPTVEQQAITGKKYKKQRDPVA
jgi:hypothetical protein